MTKKKMEIADIPKVAFSVITKPSEFFRDMPKSGGYGEPVIFMLVLAAATAVIDAILGMMGLKFVLSEGMAIAGIVMYPLIVLIAGFIWAAIMYVIWKLMGSTESYETAYRCVAFVSALMPVVAIVNAIPAVGPFLTLAAWVYFYVQATIEAHKLPAQKAWVVFGILGAVLYVITLIGGVTTQSKQRALEQQHQELLKERDAMKKDLEEMQKRMEKK